jgi:prepilin-type processing-associated H-X9-DG protein
MLLPSLSKAKESARRVSCVNGERQLGLSAIMYADDNEGQFPPRSAPLWPDRLKDYYKDSKILICPTDSNGVARTYIINGWNDYFMELLGPSVFNSVYMGYGYTNGMRETAITQPTDTIIFGEQLAGAGQMHMDYYQGYGNDIEYVDQAKHAAGAGRNKAQTGGSNFTFADGSVRFVLYGKSLSPVNMWGTTDTWRSAGSNPPIGPGSGTP